MRKLLAVVGLGFGLALSFLFGSSEAAAQCNPVYNTTSTLPACVARQQLPIIVPSGQSVTIQSGASLLCEPGSSCTGGSVVPSAIAYTQAGTGAVSQTLTQRIAQYLSDTEYTTQVNAYNQAVASAVPLLQTPSINVGSTCGGTVSPPTPPTEPCVGGFNRKGFLTGNLSIGNWIDGTDAFVNARIDNMYVNPNQEMRGVSAAQRTYRTTPDEPTLGWDIIPIVGAAVVEASNTQRIVGNIKSVAAEIHLVAPSVGTYSARNAYNLQASLVTLGTGVTLDNWQGLIVSATPTGGGTITTGYGIEIGAITATNAAAVKLDGRGDAGAIKWTTTKIFEDVSGKFTLDAGGDFVVFANPLLTTSVGGAGGASALPATPLGYWRTIIGGTPVVFPFYPHP